MECALSGIKRTMFIMKQIIYIYILHISYYENVWNTLKNIFNIFSPWDIHVEKKRFDELLYR